MSQENVEIARAVIEAGNRGDWDAALKDAAPNFEWDQSGALGADNRAVWSRDEAMRYFKGAREVWESAWIEIEELIPVGDHVVVPHITHVRGRDDIEAQARTTWLFTVRNGKIERICLYQDKAQALEAAGLRE